MEMARAPLGPSPFVSVWRTSAAVMRCLPGLELVELAKVALEDSVLVLIAQKVDGLDDLGDVVVVLAGDGVDRGSGSGTFGAEEAAVGADGFEQQFERLL